MTDTSHETKMAPARRVDLQLQVVYSLVLVSGFAALTYEASWSRLVGLVLGHTAEAAAIVLAAFFTGMAVGQSLHAVFGTKRPLLIFGFAELCTAAGAFAVPTLLDWVGEGDRFWSSFGCFAVLLPATIPMGTTLPIMVDFLIANKDSTAHVPGLYAANTLGGLLGIVAATAVLLIVVGVRTSNYVTASISALCGVVALLCEWRKSVSMNAVSSGGQYKASMVWSWTVLVAISGFVTMGLEVLYTRLFELVLQNSLYTFGAVLAAFLFALTLGAVASIFVKRWVRSEQILAAGALMGCTITVSVSLFLFRQTTALEYFSAGQSFLAYLVATTGLIAIVILPPIICLGMVFPIALRAVAGAARVGLLSAANSLAGAVGSIVAGFVLPSAFGLWPTFGIFVGLVGLTAAVVLFRSRGPSSAALVGVGAIVLAVVSGTSPDFVPQGTELVRRWESPYGWIDVVRHKATGSLQLRQNLHYQHGSTSTAVREHRQGRLPLALHSDPRDVAFLGLGTGNTASPVVLDPAVKRAVIVELVPQVVEAARLHSGTNLGVVDSPKVEVRIADARTFLRRDPQMFDVIVSDLYVPWENRAAYLYSLDFYRLVRNRMKPGGLFCQWIALYQVGEQDFRLIADTFASVFPETTIWWGQLDSRYPIVALVGSEKTQFVSQDLLEKRLRSQEGLPGGPDPDLYLPQDVTDLFMGSWKSPTNLRLNSDEHPWLELMAPMSHRDNRTLYGTLLRNFFDDTLSRLPSSGFEFVGDLRDHTHYVDRRRARQRLSLFGDVPNSAGDENRGEEKPGVPR